jgi:hypothetical protein
MITRLASPEVALEQLALEFAEQLLAAAISAPISELRDVLRDESLLRESILRAVVSALRSETPELPAIRVPRARRPRAGAVRRLPAARAALAPVHARTRFDEVDDGDAFANAITDPSLLLDVISDGRDGREHRTVPRDPPPESPLLAPKPPAASEHGPTLRPGESLQRTAGGGVVLRRGAK